MKEITDKITDGAKAADKAIDSLVILKLSRKDHTQSGGGRTDVLQQRTHRDKKIGESRGTSHIHKPFITI